LVGKQARRPLPRGMLMALLQLRKRKVKGKIWPLPRREGEEYMLYTYTTFIHVNTRYRLFLIPIL
jgi:hypothetical protein